MALKPALLFIMGAGGYGAMELIYRRRTHWTMLITGGLCFVMLCAIAVSDFPMIIQYLLGGAMITAVEFSVGCLVNLRLGWNVWDYSQCRGNIMGQICPAYSVIWLILTAPAIHLAKWAVNALY